jgi:hypothetical protein
MMMDTGQGNVATEPRVHSPADGGTARRVTVLGATGSVGQSTLDVIGRNPHLFEVVALTANSNASGGAASCAPCRSGG